MRHIVPSAFLALCCLLQAGCAPAPAPPSMGPGEIFGAGWLFIIFVAVLVYVLLKDKEKGCPDSPGHLNEAINDMNERLKQVEKKIEKLTDTLGQ